MTVRGSVFAAASVLAGAMKLLVLAIVPIVVMIVPVTLLLGQLALWYQARPLKVGEEAVITLKLDGEVVHRGRPSRWIPTTEFEDAHGAVRVYSQRAGSRRAPCAGGRAADDEVASWRR